jgi:hypothetical protein
MLARAEELVHSALLIAAHLRAISLLEHLPVGQVLVQPAFLRAAHLRAKIAL